MGYFEVWKKMMKVDNSTEAIINNGNDLIIREFKNDPSYRSAIIQKLDLSQENIDIRLKNVERTVNEKKVLFLPNTQVDVGSYITYGDKTFLITEFQDDNTLSPYSKAKLCNQTLNWSGLDKPIKCVCEDTAYNDKGEINLDYFSMVDGKIAIFVPVNEITNQIKQNMRFIFNHNKMMVFEVISIKNVSTPSIYKIVMKKVEYFAEKDDLVNNIADNSKLIEGNQHIVQPSDGYDVSSSFGGFELNQYSASTFTVMKDGVADTETWIITIDYNGVSNEHIKVESITSNSIKIRNSKGSNTNKLKINFVKGDLNISREVGLIK